MNRLQNTDVNLTVGAEDVSAYLAGSLEWNQASDVYFNASVEWFCPQSIKKFAVTASAPKIIYPTASSKTNSANSTNSTNSANSTNATDDTWAQLRIENVFFRITKYRNGTNASTESYVLPPPPGPLDSNPGWLGASEEDDADDKLEDNADDKVEDEDDLENNPDKVPGWWVMQFGGSVSVDTLPSISDKKDFFSGAGGGNISIYGFAETEKLSQLANNTQITVGRMRCGKMRSAQTTVHEHECVL